MGLAAQVGPRRRRWPLIARSRPRWRGALGRMGRAAGRAGGDAAGRAAAVSLIFLAGGGEMRGWLRPGGSAALV